MDVKANAIRTACRQVLPVTLLIAAAGRAQSSGARSGTVTSQADRPWHAPASGATAGDEVLPGSDGGVD